MQLSGVGGTQLGQAAPQGRIRTKCSRFSHISRPTLQAWMGLPALTSGSPGPDPMGESSPLPGEGSPSPIPPEHGGPWEGWLPRAGSLHTGYIGHKPRLSSAFNYRSREVAQQSEKIESGSPGTARSGQQTVQLRDKARHLPAEASTAQSPPCHCAPVKPCRGRGCHSQHGWISTGARQSSWAAWGHPTELGCTQRPPGHSSKGGTWLHTTSIPQGSHPSTTPACSPAGQALLP